MRTISQESAIDAANRTTVIALENPR